MTLFSRLFKPAWQQPEAGRRAEAVANGKDPALLAALPTLATQDPSPRVRRAALQRLGDLGLWADRSRHDADTQLRADARRAYLNGLVETDDDGLEAAVRLLRVEESSEVIDAVAQRARQPQLRRQALERVQRSGLLADCALSDPDPEVRLWLVERIDAEATLKRLVEQARKRDKRVCKAARERLEQLRLAAGNEAAVLQRAQDLCQQIDQLIHELPADGEARLAALQQAWLALPLAQDEEWQRRANGLLETAQAALAARLQPRQPKTAAADATAQPDAAPAPGPHDAAPATADPAPAAEAQAEGEAGAVAAPVDDAAAAQTTSVDPALLELQQRLSQAIDAAAQGEAIDLDSLRQAVATLAATPAGIDASDLQRLLGRLERAVEAATRRQAEASVAAELARLRSALTEQQALQARDCLKRIDDWRQQLGGLPRSLRGEHAELRTEARKLIDWQHWSNNEIRRRLCDELAELGSSQLHPDAVATRIRELQAEWKRIDALEGLDAGDPPRGLARRFHALVQQTLKPARPYFEKRAELRRERTDALQQQASDLEARLAQAGADRKALLALRRELAESMRRLDEVDPRQRRALGQRLRADLSSLDARLAEQAERVELDKRKLLAELRRDLAALPVEQRADRAKRAQAQWKQLGQGERRRDQQQWLELRELVDPVFLDAHAERQADEAAEQARRAAVEEVLAGIAQRLDGGDAGVAELEQTLARARQDLATLAPLPRALEGRAEAALSRLQEQLLEAQRQARLSSYLALAARAARLDRIEERWLAGHGLARDELAELVDASPLSEATLQQALACRRDRLLSLAGDADEADMSTVLAALETQQQAAEALLLECEFHVGVDSPAELRKARMDLQVRKLAERMGGGGTTASAQQSARLWAGWHGVGPLAAPARAALAARFAACREALEASLGA